MSKKIPYPGSYYDCLGFKRWLNDHSAQGLQWKGFTFFGTTPIFEEAELRYMGYYMEPLCALSRGNSILASDDRGLPEFDPIFLHNPHINLEDQK